MDVILDAAEWKLTLVYIDNFVTTFNARTDLFRSRRNLRESFTAYTIHGFHTAAKLTESRLCFGLCNVSRLIVLGFATLAAPLNKQLQKGQTSAFQTLNDEELPFIRSMMNALTSSADLTHPNYTGHVLLHPKTRGIWGLCVLLQRQPGETASHKGNVRGYWKERNFHLKPHKGRVFLSFEPVFYYLENVIFNVRVDHDYEMCILNLINSTGTVTRLLLGQFE